MNCNESEDRISLYIDGELSGDETESVKKHMKSCPECNKLYNEFKSVDGLIDNIPHISPERINAHDLLTKGKMGGSALPMFNSRRIALAGAFLILLALGLFAAKDIFFTPSPGPPQPGIAGNRAITSEQEIIRLDYDVQLNDTVYNVAVEGEGVRMISFDLTVNDVEGVSMEFAREE